MQPAPHPNTHALLLDVDGVLIVPPSTFHAQFIAAHGQLLRDFFHGPFASALTGGSDIRDHLPPLISALGRSETPEAYMQAWCDFENHPNHALIGAVGALRARGWRVYLATNQEAYRLRHLQDVSGLGAVTDGEFASCSVGHSKPSPEYYAEVTRRLKLPPEHIVFWDDLLENVEAARSAGWDARLYTDFESFENAMEHLKP